MKINKLFLILVYGIKLYGAEPANNYIHISANKYPQLSYSIAKMYRDEFNNAFMLGVAGGPKIPDNEKKAQMLLEWSGFGLRHQDISEYRNEFCKLALELMIMQELDDQTRKDLKEAIMYAIDENLKIIKHLKLEAVKNKSK